MVHLSYGLKDGCPLNFDKELDRLILLKIIGHRYSFLFEDVWFILIQYMYFEKFFVINFVYLGGNDDWKNPPEWMFLVEDVTGIDLWWIQTMKAVGFIIFNSIYTAIISLGGLATIPFCFKMIKQGKTKEKIFYILSFIQILLQVLFPFIRSGLIILNLTNVGNSWRPDESMRVFDRVYDGKAIHGTSHDCISVGFQVYFFPIQLFDSKQLKFNEMLFKNFT